MNLKNKKVAVLGFGIEGKDLVSYLLKQNANVTVLDQEKKSELDLKGVNNEKVNFVCGKDYLKYLNDFDIIFRSPGVYRFKKELVKVEKKGAKISSAMKLFFDLCPAQIIGITGTKGKGTTSTLIYEILKKSGKDVYLAGNIGRPFLKLLPKLKKSSWVVLELSSFQLIDLEKSPHIAVVLNITSDHMDWHKDIKEYVNAKKNIVKYQTNDDFGVFNYDFKIAKDISSIGNGQKYFFSKSKTVKGCFVNDNNIILNIDGKVENVGVTDNLSLRGKHNWENITAGICVASLAGADLHSIRSVAFSFKGLEHRLELIGTVNGVGFYNDSFATGPQPTIAAIGSFTEPITLILGGYDKGLDYGGLVKVINESVNVKDIVLIGDIGKKLKRLLTKNMYKGNLLDLGKSSMDIIVNKAYKLTPKSGIVLLSPAAASFDMFDSYKDRGEQFKKAVWNLQQNEKN